MSINKIFAEKFEVKGDFSGQEVNSLEFVKQYGIDIHIDIYDNSFQIELKNLNHTHHTNNCILENLIFPSNVENIEIINNINYYNLLNISNISNIKLYNLSENLLQLKISSSGILFDLSNIPTSLFLLDVSECKLKLNFDYLPIGLKILYLPEFPILVKDNYNYPYNLSDLSNLPSSLIQINIGYSINFKSIDDLMKTFDKIIFLSTTCKK